MQIEQKAKAMFEAYNAQGPNPGKTWDGKDVPPWTDLNDQVRGKWVAAARARESLEGAFIHPAFSVHNLNERGKTNAALLAVEFTRLLEFIEGIAPVGREFALVVTNLEQACFWAKKAMAKDPANQQ